KWARLRADWRATCRPTKWARLRADWRATCRATKWAGLRADWWAGGRGSCWANCRTCWRAIRWGSRDKDKAKPGYSTLDQKLVCRWTYQWSCRRTSWWADWRASRGDRHRVR